MNIKLTPENKAFIRENAHKYTSYQFAVMFDMVRESIIRFCKQNNIDILKKDVSRVISDSDIEYIRENAHQLTSRQVAEKYNCAVVTVNNYCRKHDIILVDGRLKNCFTEDQVRLIYELKDNMYARQIINQPEFKGISIDKIDYFARKNGICFNTNNVPKKVEKYKPKGLFNVDEHKEWVI